MFAKPRAKKTLLPPPGRKRKTEHALEEITFDPDKRADYLTGFHRRKQARIKHAQEVAEQKAKKLKIETRKRIREERMRDAEEHINMVHRLLKEARNAVKDVDDRSEEEDDEWAGIPDHVTEEPLVDKEEEYVEEDRFTTVTVEAVTLDRSGLHKIGTGGGDDDDGADEVERGGNKSAAIGNSVQRKTPKTKKFRYENKTERKLVERKRKAKKERK